MGRAHNRIAGAESAPRARGDSRTGEQQSDAGQPVARPEQPEYRDDYPLSEAIRDAHTEGLNGGQSWSASRVYTDERDYAMARADRLEVEVALLRAVEAAARRWLSETGGGLHVNTAKGRQDTRRAIEKLEAHRAA